MSRNKQAGYFDRNPFFRVLFREVDRMCGSFVYLFTTLLGPLFAFVLLLAIFNEGVPRNLSVALVDQDNSNLSRKMGMWIDAAPEAEVSLRMPNLAEAYHQMETGHIDAVVLIPKETEKNILKGVQQEIPVFVNNANMLKGGYLQKGIYKTLATLSGGIKVQVAMKHGLSERQAMEQAQPVKLHQHILFNPFGNYAYFLLTALLPLMLVVFTLLSTVYAVGTEVRDGSGPQWLEQSEGSLIVGIAGKLTPYTFLFVFIAMVMNMILFVQMGTPLRGEFLLIALGELALIMAYQMLGVLLVAVTSNLRLALSLGSAYSMMALTFSGLTFPQFAMPALANAFTWLFPFTYWVKLFISQALRGEAVVYGIGFLAILPLFIGLPVLCFPRLKRILQNERFWGKV
nr:ABC transporter permease [Sunxiuqinia sp.]